MEKATLILLAMFLCLSACSQKQKVTFVCEHGSAKSVVAASYLKRIANEEGLDIEVVSRGISPDKTIPEKINQFLESDGLRRYTESPKKLSVTDIRDSDYIISFNPLPDSLGNLPNFIRWNVPPIDSGYTAARDSIVTNIKSFIQRIKSDSQK
jgi:arsenate reductase (thioredoxin)